MSLTVTTALLSIEAGFQQHTADLEVMLAMNVTCICYCFVYAVPFDVRKVIFSCAMPGLQVVLLPADDTSI